MMSPPMSWRDVSSFASVEIRPPEVATQHETNLVAHERRNTDTCGQRGDIDPAASGGEQSRREDQ